MGQVSKSTANNIYVNEGNQLVLYVDVETGALMLKDFNGITQAVSEYVGGASGNFIKNQTTLQNAANFNISGKGSFGGSLGTESLNVKGKINLNDQFFNIAIGENALAQNESGEANVAISQSALSSNTIGGQNIAIGHNSLSSNTEGQSNIGIGINALFSNVTGVSNIGIGAATLSLNETGAYNIAIGNNTLENNTSGENNIAIGQGALALNVAAKENIAIGYDALQDNVTGQNNIGIGSEIQSKNFSNCILIGTKTIAKADNEFALGSITDPIGNVVADASFTSDFKFQINLNGIVYYIPLKLIT